jgi:ArsR family transcriptional regulator
MKSCSFEASIMLHGEFRNARVAFLKALSDETRLEILEALSARKEMTVSEICATLGKDQSNVSHHLACLRNCGVVTTRRDGKYVYYALNGRKRVGKILDLTDAHVREVLDRILACDVVGWPE